MRRLSRRRAMRNSGLAIAAAMAVYGFASNADASVLFNDNLKTSTINVASPSAPTLSSTNYDIASSKAATNDAINNSTGDLTLKLNSSTTSGFVEMEALFSTDPTPFALTNTGDTIEYDVTFTDTSSIIAGGTSSYILFGLYNSEGGSGPYNNLNNSGLNTSAGSADATGGVANWLGYVEQFGMSGGTNKIYTRPAQTGAGTTSANQDLLGNNFGGGAFNNPTGTQVGSTQSSTLSLTTGASYTADMLITLLPSGQLSIVDTLYQGGTSGTILQSQSGTTTSVLVQSFDGLAFGLRNSGTSFDPTADITNVSVDYTPAAPVPEPAALGLLGLSGLALAHRRRRKV